MDLIPPYEASLLQKVPLPRQFMRISDGVLVAAASLYSDRWLRSTLSDEERWRLDDYRKANEWRSYPWPVTEVQEARYRADSEVDGEVECALEKLLLRERVLQQAWADIRQALHDEIVICRITDTSGFTMDVPAYCWASPVLDLPGVRSRDTSLLFIRKPDGATMKGLGSFERDDFTRGLATGQPASKALPAISKRSGLPGRPSSRPIWMPEGLARIERGELQASHAEFCRVLANWLKAEHPNEPAAGASGLRGVSELKSAWFKAKGKLAGFPDAA